MTGSAWGKRLARLHPFVWIGAAAVAAGLVAWPLGGWDTVELESAEIPSAEPGELVQALPFSIAVHGAEITTVHPDGFSEREPGWEWLVLDLEAVNETDITDLSSSLADSYSGSITIDDGVLGWGTTAQNADGFEERGRPYLALDGTFLPDLQPGLPARMDWVFEIPEGTWSPGDELVVGIVDRTAYERSLGSGTGYMYPTVIAEVAVPIEQGAVETPEPGTPEPGTPEPEEP